MEEIICTLCGKKIDNPPEWVWNEEGAHKECVLESAIWICSRCGDWYESDVGENELYCELCGGRMRPITNADRKRARKQG